MWAKPHRVRTSRRSAWADPAVYRAAAALPNGNRTRAVHELRQQLAVMAVAGGTTPDWRTLSIAGPTVVAGAEARSRFEWRATVAVRGESVFDAWPDPDVLPFVTFEDDDTLPFGVVRRAA